MLNGLLQLLGFVLLILALMTGALWLFQDQLIFHPQPVPPGNRNLYQSYQVSFRNGDARLHGWYLPAAGAEPRPLLIYYGGNAEEVSWNIPWFRQNLDVSLLLVNYRGFGDSDGKPSETVMKKDALAIYDQLSSTPTTEQSALIKPSSAIFIMGRSLGSGVASWVASQRPADGVVLVTPYDSLATLAQAHYPFLPVAPLIRHRFESDQLAARIETPMLYLVAEQDEIVPPAHAERLASLWKGKVTRVSFADADHISISDKPGYWQAIQRFIDNPGGGQPAD